VKALVVDTVNATGARRSAELIDFLKKNLEKTVSGWRVGGSGESFFCLTYKLRSSGYFQLD
jgi:hypothetical protein